jgi:hypothetical protein
MTGQVFALLGLLLLAAVAFAFLLASVFAERKAVRPLGHDLQIIGHGIFWTGVLLLFYFIARGVFQFLFGH